MKKERLYPGIWKLTFGKPDNLTPNSILGGRESEGLQKTKIYKFPFKTEEIVERHIPGGFIVTIPLDSSERLYGFGLQFQSFLQNGKRKTLRTNADSPKDTGDSHAPVPFYVSTKGYGILADTCRNVEFDCGAARMVKNAIYKDSSRKVSDNTDNLYCEEQRGQAVNVYVKGSEGVVLYVFAGENIRQAVEGYNQFCGGGVLPPIWGLGNLYRCYGPADQKQVEKILEGMIRDEMPFSMLGLEPGWHSHAYSCSFQWDTHRFPEPQKLIKKADKNGMVINLWEQPYVHPSAKYYKELIPYSGDYEVWGGLAPDFALTQAQNIYGKIQGELIDAGIMAVKLDECDGADYTGGWFFPDFAQFPSGLNGEQEKNLYGAMVQRTINHQFEQRNLRTYSQIRANWSYGTPMGFVLYSDLYDHSEFVRAISNAGFCGLLWAPEVRQCESGEEFIRRMQSVIFSPLSIINAWMVPNPPWKQYDIKKNKEGDLLESTELQDRCRELLRLRNAFIPYLYEAFARYTKNGTPPFRALVLDYPEDERVFTIDDAYMMGESLLVAPILHGNTGRNVYLPIGVWYDFWKGQRYDGGCDIWMETQQIPLFVRADTILPLARNKSITKDTVFELDVRVYGKNPGSTWLVEDDGISLNYLRGEQIWHELSVSANELNYPTMNKYQILSEKHFV